MDNSFDCFAFEALEDIKKFDKDDFFSYLDKYFKCGYSHDLYYNNNLATAIAIIGKLYNSNSILRNKNSNYHKGIAYIANELGISKRQVKILRKNMRVIFNNDKAYEFKIPFNIYKIINLIITLLKGKEQEELVQKFLQSHSGCLFRDLLIFKQYMAITFIADKTTNPEIINVHGELNNLIYAI